MSSLFDRIIPRRGRDEPSVAPGAAGEQPTTLQPAVPAADAPAESEAPTRVHQTAEPAPAASVEGEGSPADVPADAGVAASPADVPAEAGSGAEATPGSGDGGAHAAAQAPVTRPRAPWETTGDGPSPAAGEYGRSGTLEPPTAVEQVPGPAPTSDAPVADPADPAAAAGGPAAAAAPAPDQAPAAASPADLAAPAVPAKVSVRDRGRMRRRLRYLRRVRELGYRDLGGLVFELRRAGAQNEVLVGAKFDALVRIDAELHALERGLRDFQPIEELHEPGVSVCVRCGALHGSEANFCPQCGVRVGHTGAAPGSPAPPPAAVAPGPPTGSQPTAGAAPTTGQGPAGAPPGR